MPQITVKVLMQPGAFLRVKKAFMICEITHDIVVNADLNAVFDDVQRKAGFSDMIWSHAQYCGSLGQHGFWQEAYEKDDHVQISGPVQDGDCLTFWVVPLSKYQEEHVQTMKTSKMLWDSIPLKVKEAYVSITLRKGECCPITLEPFRPGQKIALTTCWHIFDDEALDKHFLRTTTGEGFHCPVCRQPVMHSEVLMAKGAKEEES
jgi:hypothetical protein